MSFGENQAEGLDSVQGLGRKNSGPISHPHGPMDFAHSVVLSSLPSA